MNEWTVVTALVVVVGLFATLAKPLLKLNTTLVKLDDNVTSLRQSLTDQTASNKEAHTKIWAHESEQDKRLENHETRIERLEGR